MSFSLNDVNVKNKVTRADKFRACFSYVNNNFLLNSHIKYALNKYINYRLKQRNCNGFSSKTLERLTIEMLEFCCNKNINDINPEDVNNNEAQILYEIKKSVYYGSTRQLYYDGSTFINTDILTKKDSVPPKRISNSDCIDDQTVVDYFKDLMI